MFCTECGTQVVEGAASCSKCGRVAARPASDVAAQVREQIRESSTDAVRAFGALLVNPVGGLRTAYATLGHTRALGAGLGLVVLFALLGALAASVAAGRSTAGWFGMFAVGDYGSSRLSTFLKTFTGLLVLPGAMTFVCHGFRRLTSSGGSLVPDLFTAGASLLPLGLASLIAVLLGAGNFEVASVLMLFAVCYLVLILFTGLKELGALGEKAAAPATPLALLASLWLTKVVFVALL